MKTLFISFLILASSFAHSADKQLHKDMNAWLNSKFLATQSTTPNKALVYISNDTNADFIGKQIVAIDSPDVTDGQIVITKPTTSIDKQIPDATVASISSSLTSCQANFGEVTITPTQLIVYTDRLPISILCKGTGGMRMFFTTIQE